MTLHFGFSAIFTERGSDVVFIQLVLQKNNALAEGNQQDGGNEH